MRVDRKLVQRFGDLGYGGWSFVRGKGVVCEIKCSADRDNKEG